MQLHVTTRVAACLLFKAANTNTQRRRIDHAIPRLNDRCIGVATLQRSLLMPFTLTNTLPRCVQRQHHDCFAAPEFNHENAEAVPIGFNLVFGGAPAVVETAASGP